MQDIQRALTTAARRLYLNAFLRAAVLMATVSAGALLFLVAVQKLGPLTFDWPLVAGVAAGITVVTALIAAWAQRQKGVALADELDRRAGLRETLSTAIALKANDTAWAVAVKESAADRARRIVMRDAVPIAPPRGWQTPLALALAAGGALWLAPRYDLSGVLDRRAEEEQQQAEIRTTALEIKAQENELKEILEQAGVEMEEDETGDEGAENEKPESAEELKRAALKKLTNLSDKLTEKMNGEKAQQTKALQENMERLKTPGPGPMTEFARSMARGQFDKARESLEELSKAVQDGSMTEEQGTQAAEQLKALAEQMEQLAQQKEALTQELEKLGMDSEQAKKMANDPNALKEALQQMQGLSQSQQQSLMNQANAQQQASESMQSMAQSMSQLAQQMQSACQNPGGQDGKPSQSQCQSMQASMNQMANQLSACEMASAEMQSLKAAMGQCQSQMSAMGQSLCQNPNANGKGIGAANVANDLDAPRAASDDYMLKAEKTNVPNMGGPIIGSTMVYGAQVRGEATAQFGEAVNASAIQAAEAIESMQVPREYHDAVRHYFGRLEKAAGSDQEPGSSGD